MARCDGAVEGRIRKVREAGQAQQARQAHGAICQVPGVTAMGDSLFVTVCSGVAITSFAIAFTATLIFVVLAIRVFPEGFPRRWLTMMNAIIPGLMGLSASSCIAVAIISLVKSVFVVHDTGILEFLAAMAGAFSGGCVYRHWRNKVRQAR